MGATDGNIIAAIITSQTPANHVSVPSSVHGPPSMPCISSAVHSQPTAERPKRRATSPMRVRAAARAGASPGGPGAFLGRRDQALKRPTRRVPTALSSSYSMPKALIRDRVGGGCQLRGDGVEHARQASGLPGLDAERHDVLDLEVDRVSIRTWRRPSSTTSIGARSTPSTSPINRANPAIGPPFCPPKTAVSFSTWSSLARPRRRACRDASCRPS